MDATLPMRDTFGASDSSSIQGCNISGPSVILGLDYGTSNTSIAFRLSTWAKDRKPTILSSFPGDPQGHLNGRQLPSLIAYSTDDLKKPLIGFEALNLFAKPSGHPARASYPRKLQVERGKLLLYQSRHTEDARADLIRKLRRLRQIGLIQEDHDVISDFLTACFKHVKLVLQNDHGIDNKWNVEVSFCVPVVGTPSSNLIMSMCVRKAMQQADFGTGGTTPYNIFMVNEAEAAAMYAVESGFHEIRADETIMNVDSGGGTTEGAVHLISRGDPLRLSREVIAAKGIMWGGTDVNQDFRMELQEDLEDGNRFGTIEPGWTKSDLIEACVRDFDIQKRSFVDADNNGTFEFRMPGLLQSDVNPRLTQGYYVLTSKEMGEIIGRVASKVEDFMLNLLDHARAVTPELHKVVLTGGFGDSPYLRAKLRRSLSEYNDENSTIIDFIVAPSQRSGTSTAIGTLLRTLNKEHGPLRALRMSVGVVRDIRYQPAMYRELGMPEVSQQQRKRGKDGKYYIPQVVQWLLKSGADTSKRSYKTTFKSSHLFAEGDERWIASEELIMHPTATRDYFKLDGPKNAGYISGGSADFDVTHLKSRIMKKQELEKSRGREPWALDLDVCVETNDIDIRLTAFYKGSEVPGFRVCHNVRGLLDPGTDE